MRDRGGRGRRVRMPCSWCGRRGRQLRTGAACALRRVAAAVTSSGERQRCDVAAHAPADAGRGVSIDACRSNAKTIYINASMLYQYNDSSATAFMSTRGAGVRGPIAISRIRHASASYGSVIPHLIARESSTSCAAAGARSPLGAPARPGRGPPVRGAGGGRVLQPRPALRQWPQASSVLHDSTAVVARLGASRHGPWPGSRRAAAPLTADRVGRASGRRRTASPRVRVAQDSFNARRERPRAAPPAGRRAAEDLAPRASRSERGGAE